LQNILPGIAGPIMGQPETYLTMVGDAFNDKGELIKEPLQKVLEQFLAAFAAWVEKQNR
jgi:chromate reductase